MPETVEADTSTIVMAPMPGMLKSVDVEVGQEVSYLEKRGKGALRPETVEAGTSTIVLPAMPGILKSVVVEVGQEVIYWWSGKRGGGGAKLAQLSAFMPKTVKADTSTILMATIPGMLKSIDVEVGQEVSYLEKGG